MKNIISSVTTAALAAAASIGTSNLPAMPPLGTNAPPIPDGTDPVMPDMPARFAANRAKIAPWLHSAVSEEGAPGAALSVSGGSAAPR